MLAGQTGQFNVSQEGIMLASEALAFLGTYQFGSLWAGVLTAALTGALFGLAFSYFTTTLKMNQFVIGLALFFVGLGLSTLAFKLAIGITLTPPQIPTLRKISIPLLGHIPVIGEIVFNQNIFVYFAVLLSLLLYYFLYRTQFGLELRAVGESSKTADSMGISVPRARYLTAILGGMLIGVALLNWVDSAVLTTILGVLPVGYALYGLFAPTLPGPMALGLLPGCWEEH